MKYPRGSYLQWTEKALSPKREGSSQRSKDDRMIVISHDEVAFVHKGVVEQLDMYKTHDSYVTLAKEPMPKGLKVDKAEVLRCNADVLVKEFGLVVTPDYKGRKR